jgi:hypothetical protein
MRRYNYSPQGGGNKISNPPSRKGIKNRDYSSSRGRK